MARPQRHAEAAAGADVDPSLQDAELLRRLLRARDAIDRASEQDWPIARLAAISCVCEAHFARSFRQAFGLPPHRYLLTRRVERALALLRDTTMPITEIAFATGWSSLGTFGRVFKDITGGNPGDLRRDTRDQAAGLAPVPACVVSAAQRPDLRSSVSEKRRQGAAGDAAPAPTPTAPEES